MNIYGNYIEESNFNINQIKISYSSDVQQSSQITNFIKTHINEAVDKLAKKTLDLWDDYYSKNSPVKKSQVKSIVKEFLDYVEVDTFEGNITIVYNANYFHHKDSEKLLAGMSISTGFVVSPDTLKVLETF